MTQGQLLTPHAVRQFALAGNATFTLRSERSGQRFTYRVRKDANAPVWYVAWLRGVDNEADYSYFGFLRGSPMPMFYHGKAKASQDAPCVQAFQWLWERLWQGVLHPQTSIWHQGKCGACGRALTVPESIASGLGPECARRHLSAGSIPQAAVPRSFSLTDLGA